MAKYTIVAKNNFDCAISVSSVTLLSSSGNAMAIGDMQLDYIEGALGRYLENTEYASLGDVGISEAFMLYDLSTSQIANGDIYVVFNNDTVIGTLCVDYYEGNYYSSFNKSGIEYLQNAYNDGKQIAYSCNNGESLLFDGYDFFSRKTENMTDYSFDDENNISVNTLNIAYDDFQRNLSESSRSVSISCDLEGALEPVSNYPINGGICWAASVAIKYNYVNGYYTGDAGRIDAMDVFEAVRQKMGGSPEGTVTNQKYAMSHFGLYDTYTGGSVPIVAIMTEISHDNPVIISVNGTVGAHSVVIGGVVYRDNASTTFTIADSNFPDLMQCECTANQAESQISTFYYYDAAYGGAFTNWYQTFSYMPNNSYIA